MFKKAVKRDAKLRLALTGPSGSGKTFTALKLASALGGPIAVVDTERGSASKYAHTDTCGDQCADESHFHFDVMEPADYDPRNLVKAIDAAITAGYSVLIADSLSHFWMGVGGELDLVDAAAKQNKNSFAAWKTVTPLHNKLIDRMLSAPLHIIVTMRSKTEWVIEKDDKGKNVPRKIGLQPVMRDGIEFEFDVSGEMDQDNTLAISKSRCSALQGKVINRPGREMAATLREWLAGAPIEAPIPADERHATNGAASQGGPGAAQAATASAITGPSPRPVPEELLDMFGRIDRDHKFIADAFKILEKALVEAGEANGVKEYDRLVKALRAKYPKGQVMPLPEVKECLMDLFEATQTIQPPEPFTATDADLPEGLFGK